MVIQYLYMSISLDPKPGLTQIYRESDWYSTSKKSTVDMVKATMMVKEMRSN